MNAWLDEEPDEDEPRSILRKGRGRAWLAVFIVGVMIIGFLALTILLIRGMLIDQAPPAPRPPELKEGVPPPRLPAVDYEPDIGIWPEPGDVERILPLPGDQWEAVVPATPSPFVLLQGVQRRESRLVNLQTWEETLWKQRPFREQRICLSPDGKHYAALYGGEVVVFAIAKEPNEVQRFTRDANPGASHYMPFAFVTPEKLVVAAGMTMLIHVLEKGPQPAPMPLESGPFHTFADGVETGQTSAVSPNGRNVAILGQSREIAIYDLQKRGIAARLAVPFQDNLMHCVGLAFSRDGKRMACAVQAWPKGELFVFDIGKSALLQTIPFKASGIERHRVGEGLEWLPDDAGWLVGGLYLIDAKQEATLWQSPRLDFLEGWQKGAIPRLHGAWHVTALKSNKLSLHPLPRAEIEELRAAKRIDKDKIPRLQRPDEAAAWKGRADAVPVSIATPPSILLREKAADVVRVLFSQGEAPRVVVLDREYGGKLERVIPLHASVYDLKSGQPQARFKLSDVPARHLTIHHPVADVDPNGSIFAFVNPETPRRLDVWSLDGKQLHAWIPYVDGLDEIARVFAVSDSRVLTLTKQGRLTLWNLADRTPIFHADDVKNDIALSATRKFLAIGGAKGIDLFESANGAFKGRLALPFKHIGGIQVLGFTPDGTRLLAYANESEMPAKGKEAQGKGDRLVVWDMEAGAALRHFPLQGLFGRLSISKYWCGQDFLLSDFGKLIDFKSGMVLWDYQLPALCNGMKFGGFFPDQRLWTFGPQRIAVAKFGTAPGEIRPIDMPTPEALALSQSIEMLPGARHVPLTGESFRFSVEMEGKNEQVAVLLGQLRQSAITPGYWANDKAGKSVVLTVNGAATVTIRDETGAILWENSAWAKKTTFEAVVRDVPSIRWPDRVMKAGDRVIALPGRTKLFP